MTAVFLKQSKEPVSHSMNPNDISWMNGRESGGKIVLSTSELLHFTIIFPLKSLKRISFHSVIFKSRVATQEKTRNGI